MLKKMFTLVVLFAIMISGSICFANDSETRIAEIKARYNQLKPFYDGETFDVAPSIVAPYAAGTVNREYLNDGLAFLNFQRFIAGIPDDVILSDEWVETSQKGAVLLATNNELNHCPTQPVDMDKDFYEEGRRSTRSSNISRRSSSNGISYSPIRDALMGQADDSSSNSNLECVGHRRWLLNQDMLYTAFGVADNGNSRFTTVYAHDTSRPASQDPLEYILWPAAPAFPKEFAKPTIPWSIQTCLYDYALPELEQVTVTLTRREDGKVWVFNDSYNTPSETGRYFNIDKASYGGVEHPTCIIFRPEGITEYSGIYDVKVSGLTNREGTVSKDIEYSVEFFELDNELNELPGSSNPGEPENGGSSSGGGGSSGGCNAGLGALALLLFVPLFFRKK